ncbi:MAG: amidohydrolase [Sphaerochaetaceae bacterium]
MNTLIRNGLVLPLTSKDAQFIGDLAIADGRIAGLGKIPAGFVAEKTIDASGCIVMPAFVNAHTHLAMVLMRNYKDQGNLFRWLSEIFPIEDKLVQDDIYAASLVGAAEMIESGTVLFADMYFHASMTAKAIREAGMKANIGFTLFGDLASSKTRLAERMPPLERELKSDGMVRVDPAPHAIYTTTGESYRFASDLARDLGTRLHTHLSETRKEVSDSLHEFGKTPAFYLESLGVLDATPAYLAHGVHLTEQEIAMLRGKRIALVHNPASNCKLGSGIADLCKWRDNGIDIALGTDGASSNNNLNLLKDINLALMINSVSAEDFETRFTPFEMLRLATYGGAKALGRESETGTLEAGKDADIQIIDMRTPATTPMNDPYSAIAYSADKENIKTVMCRGRLLMENRRLLTIDKALAMSETNKAWDSIKKR